ncbi:large ribosomal subunit protein uL22m-like [Babylonia areolata]|uniref:large ribosomal subunit protein uL22m-like n=1 Tax=Babylonia areolata TaxID=304850 RepID=UPI003FCFDD0C
MAAPLRRCFAQLTGLIRPLHVATVESCWLSLSARTVCGQPCSGSATRLLLPATSIAPQRGVHTTPPMLFFRNTEFDDEADLGVKMRSKRWDKYNTVLYPPTEKDDPARPAEICHSRFNIKYSPKKMWYIAAMIRGMSVSEAKKQLSFYRRKGAQSVLEVLEEAEELAVRDHNVEFKSNLWICDSFVGKGKVVKGIRKHMGPRYGLVRYRFVHYFVRLREGKPPEHYYTPPMTGYQKMEEYITEHRKRRIINSL